MTRPVSGTFKVGNTNLVMLRELRLASTGAYVNDATVSVTVKDSSDVEVTGESWPVTLNYVTGSDGDYAGAIDKNISISAGERLTGEVTAVSAGITLFLKVPIRVRDSFG